MKWSLHRPMALDEGIVVSSVNCRGLRDLNKRADVIDYLKQTPSNILCLQDTHWVKKDERNIQELWNNPGHINGGKTNARGVAILLKNNFEFTVLNTISDLEGNMIILDIKISKEITIRLLNIYAPNNDNPEFFLKINDYVSNNNCDYCIICGDFNLTIDPEMDS